MVAGESERKRCPSVRLPPSPALSLELAQFPVYIDTETVMCSICTCVSLEGLDIH